MYAKKLAELFTYPLNQVTVWRPFCFSQVSRVNYTTKVEHTLFISVLNSNTFEPPLCSLRQRYTFVLENGITILPVVLRELQLIKHLCVVNICVISLPNKTTVARTNCLKLCPQHSIFTQLSSGTVW